ncbi:MAG: arylsulfatase [Nitriliruptorales bacterium]|nr:arylsulfatase [Nitriliruptorales bacterium]
MPELTRRQLLRTSATAAAGLASLPSPATAAGASVSAHNGHRRPNIVFIFADDLGWGELGSYGQQIIRTPHLDQMAAEGIRFTDFYSAAPICNPSRSCLLTGMHNGHARIRENTFNYKTQESLEPEDVTFAEVAKAAGYATGIFGKWGFGPDNRSPQTIATDEVEEGHFGHPLQRGFDEFAGFVYHHHATNGYWADYWWEGNERVDIPENAGGAQGKYMPDEYVARALDFIDRHRDEPFLLFLSTILPHTPNHVPDWSEYDHLPYANDTKKHAAMITLMDAHVGLVRDKLEELGLADDTLVVFTSDNGPHNETSTYGGTDPIPVAGVTSALDEVIFQSTGPFKGVKQSMYEGGYREPMIVWGPGVLPERSHGTTSDVPWAAYDLLPTFADYMDVDPPDDIDGVSVRPWLELRADTGAPHDWLYFERIGGGAPTVLYYGTEPTSFARFAQAVRRGNWKLLRFAPGSSRDGTVDLAPTGQDESTSGGGPVVVPKDQWRVELYDLTNDPGETQDLSEAEPGVVAELVAIMDAQSQPPPYARTHDWDAAAAFDGDRGGPSTTSGESEGSSGDARLPATGGGVLVGGLAAIAGSVALRRRSADRQPDL